MIRDKLLLKIENQISSMESVVNIDSLLDEAITEADELINSKDVAEAIRFDVAYYRFLLFVSQADISELDKDMYEKAMDTIKKAPYKESKDETTPVSYGRVAQRRTFT
ncbi:hypothetical protein [Sulfurimonas sp.]|uniref:hypothetical protein n=1 Tax=Sulfurimonas sp. TaxID=2022749 RepID=UPI002B463B4B|nr:hypothetical protein [Sulfurimonas sp.]